MKTWWHRLFLVMEIALFLFGSLAFSCVYFNDTSNLGWAAVFAWGPAALMCALHAATAFVIDG